MAVFVDYSASPSIAAMQIGAMSVVERVLREAARDGADAATVRGDIPALPTLPLAVTVVAADATAPDGATPIPGDVIAGVRITDEASRRAADRALFRTLRRPYDGFGDRYVNRAFSIPLTRLLCRLRLTPNQVTWFNIVVGLAACAVAGLADGRFSMIALAGGLMFLQVILDCCDGEIARIRHLHSRFGMQLDNISDDAIDNLFLAMLAVGVGGVWLPLGLAGAAAKTMTALMIHVDVARQGKTGDVMAFKWFFDNQDANLAERYEVDKPSLFGFVRGLGRRDVYVLLYSASCLVGLPEIAIVHTLALGGVYAILTVVHLVARRPAQSSPG